ncbi:inner membrane protein [Cyclonatronum proteinivorum]|uniref:Inner membrane protein n=1 Tax=Cyclonatronum proteinivorum TaxID=1457365 RepID=A0A345UIM1_9BACT|nr:metal-dependent hydrolase [Cyclonatronum proteinivorum]AXJ00323.1 inner membrane protein [Cyclonatronum proteinivorum]
MDPLAHTLFGASMAEAGLKRKTALATTTLIIGANIPDVDAVAMFVSADYALLVRRGWTHGILALLFWPFLLTAFMLWADHLLQKWRVRKGKQRSGPPMHKGWLLGVAFLGVWSHPLLDWLNTYGIRLLMPFDGTWFYGDTLFIIDPWFWLLTGAGVVLARSESRLGLAGWIVLGTALTALITTAEIVPLTAKILWGVGVALIIGMRWSGLYRRHTQKIAAVLLTGAILYTALMYAGARLTTHHARAALQAQGTEVTAVMANPIPALVTQRTGVAASETHYYMFFINWLRPETFTLQRDPVPIIAPDEIAQVALQSPDVRGLLNWIRFPHYETRRTPNGWQVYIRDLRFVQPDQVEDIGIGMAVIDLDENLEVIQVVP